MKMKLWDRLSLCFGAVLTLASAVLLFLQALKDNNNLLYIVIAVLLAIFGVYVALLFRRCFVRRNEFVIQRTENGELRIAVKAIENQVQKCIDLHEEIQVNTLNILTTREGVVVDLEVTLANNISIPLAVASLQKQIKQYLVASSGIEVKEVRVSVESTQNADLSDAPAMEAEQPAREEKAPMHQRLFGRPEEPAIVPEPPKEENAEGEEPAAKAEETKDPAVSAWLKPAEEAESKGEPAEDAAADAPEIIQEPELVNTPPAEEAQEDQSEPLPESEITPEAPESEEKTHE
jgi:uncharacterized alkaline shock family protein YloU